MGPGGYENCKSFPVHCTLRSPSDALPHGPRHLRVTGGQPDKVVFMVVPELQNILPELSHKTQEVGTAPLVPIISVKDHRDWKESESRAASSPRTTAGCRPDLGVWCLQHRLNSHFELMFYCHLEKLGNSVLQQLINNVQPFQSLFKVTI